MAEIKLNDGFQAEVEAFRAAGEALDSVSTNSLTWGSPPLPTVDAYAMMLGKIELQIANLGYLVKKDAGDMDALAEKLKAADGAAGGGSGGGGGGSW